MRRTETGTIMRKLTLITFLAVVMTCFTRQGFTQSSLAPLYLSTNGSGSITPFQTGQLLEVGQSFQMTAIPDAGFAFDSWQQASFFVFTQFLQDAGGNPFTRTNTTVSPTTNFIDTA